MSKADIDVYREWLGIQETNRPLNYYQLLRLKPFEDNPTVIRENYRKINAHVRKYASGDYMVQSQALLNEVAKAMLCLTDSSRKQEYDASLGRKTGTQSAARRSLEEILLANSLVPQDRMKQIKGYANGVGIDLHEAVLQQKVAPPEAVMLAYAESIGLPFVSVEDIGVDEEIAPQIDPNMARMHSFVPLMVDQGQLLLASPRPVNPDVEEELRMIFEMPVRSTICTPSEINAAIAKHYPRDAVQLIRKQDGTVAAASKSPANKGSAEQTAPSESRVLNAEEKKNRLLNTIVVFNFSVMVVCFGLVYAGLLRGSWLQTPVIGLIAIAVGSIGAFITWNKFSK